MYYYFDISYDCSLWQEHIMAYYHFHDVTTVMEQMICCFDLSIWPTL
jgi:hypothetical protein